MPIITISKKETKEFSDFLSSRGLKEWFLAKDHGAYIGAYHEGDTWLKYFRGCNPDKDEYFYDTARDKFGGDDFGLHFSSDSVHQTAKAGGFLKLKIGVRKVTLEGFK